MRYYCRGFLRSYQCIKWQPQIIFLQSADILNVSSVDDQVSDYLIKNNIKHVRIPLYSAWVGAAWERLIRTIKSCLYKSVGKRTLDYFSLITLLSDIENAINSRPLTYSETDDCGLFPITPNSFLKLKCPKSILFDSLDGMQLDMPNRQDMVASLVKRDEIFEKFRDEWYESYLLSLREKGNDLYEHEWVERIKTGDVVLIKSPTKSRNCWQMGKVERLLTGADNKTRCVEVRRGDRSKGIYSINLLYPLELSLNHIEPSVEPSDEVVADVRPVRSAAQLCKQRLKNYV